MRLVALDAVAERSGLKRGQGVAEARAICPQIDVLASDPGADAVFLNALADWCDRYTPLVALDGEDGLYLDITGCAHLHGGEKPLLDDLLARLFHLGVEARGAIASSAGLSSAMARFGSRSLIALAEDAERVLASMPVAALRLPSETVALLARLGLKQVGDLLQAPRAPLARRFGPALLLRLDQAMGLEDEPLSPRLPVADLSSERRLAAPVQDESAILDLTLQLARSLRHSQEGRGEGGRLFELVLFRVDGKVFRVRAGTSAPLRDPERIAGLFRERLVALHDDLEAGFGYETVRLCVLATSRFDEHQQDFSGTADRDKPLAAFADRVMARFGPDSLSMPALHQGHIPERASTFVLLADVEQRPGGCPGKVKSRVSSSEIPPPHFHTHPSVRPVRLLRHPEPVETVADVPDGAPARFRWRRALHRVRRAEGPERIAPEWWLDGEDAPTRDYFRVEDDEGRRFWLFRNGLYGTSDILPRWFMHGVFA